MKVVLQLNDPIPAKNYGGVNRVVWALGQSLVQLGHEVVFLAPYGSLPEIITDEYGYLTDSTELLVQAMLNAHTYDAFACHEYAKQQFHSDQMAIRYLALYKKVISGESLNPENPQLQQSPRGLPWR